MIIQQCDICKRKVPILDTVVLYKKSIDYCEKCKNKVEKAKKEYEKEIEYRKMFNYPPFTDIVLFELSSSNFNIVKSESERLYNILNDSLAKYKVFSPKSPFVRRINNKYRINVLVKAKLNKEVYSQIYEKINIFNKNKNKLLNFVVTKNPTSIS